MNSRIRITLVLLLGCGTVGNALADCAADATVQQTTQRYANGQKLERQGDLAAALAAYVGAQASTCEPNPVETQAAQRAAALALPLGAAAEKRGDVARAFELYDEGGHYAAADRALMAWVRANPDDPRVFAKAREVLDYRALPAFQANNRIRLGITGVYRPDAANLTEVLGMPARGGERALKKEQSAFNEEFLRGYVQQIQSRPENPADMAAMQSWAHSYQAFMQKWSRSGDEHLLRESQDALDLVKSWAIASADQNVTAKLVAQLNERLQQRAATLVRSYADAPQLLEEAAAYEYAVYSDDDAKRQAQANAIKTQAARLGDAANAQQRYSLAIDYYDVAGQDDKAQAARDARQKQAMAAMQPQIDQMKQQAAAIQQQYSDPARVQQMQEQARALQQRLQQQQQANAKSKSKNADDLEKELGM